MAKWWWRVIAAKKRGNPAARRRGSGHNHTETGSSWNAAAKV
ncbi:hypothetical protein [Nocardia cyriacigeorgica]|nr:hypothetical protein [Nocardia cyriacigeorgica]